jgi:hypothetical protein
LTLRIFWAMLHSFVFAPAGACYFRLFRF